MRALSAGDDSLEGTPLAAASPSLRVSDERIGQVRSARPWHRYAHHIRELPARLEELSGDLRVPSGGRVLDYGCADVPYRRFFGSDVDFVPADIAGNPHARLELAADGTLPVPDASFDAVLSTQVLEHVVDPALYVSECFRVLRPGGRLLLSTHGVWVYHPDPVDLWRWTGAGLEPQVELAGFRVERREGIVGPVATGLQLVEDGLYWPCPARLRPLLCLVFETLMALADRAQSPERKRIDAQVFAVVAVRP
jgi:SAM-dependent methyltransferase